MLTLLSSKTLIELNININTTAAKQDGRSHMKGQIL